MTTPRELIERARAWIADVVTHDDRRDLLAAIDAHLSEPQPSQGRCARCGRYEDGSRPCPNGDAFCPVHPAQPDARKALAGYALVVFDEANEEGGVPDPMVIDDERAATWPEPGFLKSHLEPIYRLAAQPVQEPVGDAVMILDMFIAAGFIAPEKLKQAQAIAANFRASPATPAASVEQPPVGWQTVWVNNFLQLIGALKRADQKGYMPDAMREEWDDFEWSIRGGTAPVEQPARAPSGFVMVPIDPTDRMMDCFSGTKYATLSPGKRVNERKAYADMLAAATSAQPTSAQAQKEGGNDAARED